MCPAIERTDFVSKMTVNERKESLMTSSQAALDSQIVILHQSAWAVRDLLWLAPVLSSRWFSISSGLVRSSHADGARAKCGKEKVFGEKGARERSIRREVQTMRLEKIE
jgi:hypothetical protein